MFPSTDIGEVLLGMPQVFAHKCIGLIPLHSSSLNDNKNYAF